MAQSACSIVPSASRSRWGYDMLGNWSSVTSSTIAYDPQVADPTATVP